MDPIRVHLGPMPRMLESIIGDLLVREPDIEIAGSSAMPGDCLREARIEGAHIIVAQDRAGGTESCLDLIMARPPIGVLAVSGDGQRASGISLSRRAVTLDTQSPSLLADAIRQMAAELASGFSLSRRNSSPTADAHPTKWHPAGLTSNPPDGGGGSS